MRYGKCHCNVLPTNDDYLIDFSTAFNFVASEVNMSKFKAQTYVSSTFSPFITFTIEEKREIISKWMNNDEYSNMFLDHLNNFVFANKFIKFAKFLTAMERLQLEFGVKILEESLMRCSRLVGKTPDEALREVRFLQEDLYKHEREEMREEDSKLGICCKCEPIDFDLMTDYFWKHTNLKGNGTVTLEEKSTQIPMKCENSLVNHSWKRKTVYKNLKHGQVYGEVSNTRRRTFRDTENYRYQMRLQKNFPHELSLIFNDFIHQENKSRPQPKICKKSCFPSKLVGTKDTTPKNKLAHSAIDVQLIKLGFAHISDHLYTIPVSGIRKSRSHKQYNGLLKKKFADLKEFFAEYYNQDPEISACETEPMGQWPNSTSAISKSTKAKLRLMVEKRAKRKNQNLYTSLDIMDSTKQKSLLIVPNNSSKEKSKVKSSSSKCTAQWNSLFSRGINMPPVGLNVDDVENSSSYEKKMFVSEIGKVNALDSTPSSISDVESVALALCEFSTGMATQSSFTDKFGLSSITSGFSSSDGSLENSENLTQDSKSQVISINGIGKFQVVRVGCLQ